MTNAKRDKSPTLNVTNPPRNHPARQPDYQCGCGAGADVWDAWDVYCAKCYITKEKLKQT